ncbi:hypothetical protein [Cryobacterium sp. PH29-G1]|uniref:hypothetical protein n=1 Tax=Cryobacterium sp. PH29-G1 TaxID=3046211 RepID=UPI0024B8DC39|nr:hypothetical protein [Cryobacterium sp. PH29-G1]MDJ0348363.1 hypothetical protein [Cryobacterium sp. PH29-G1]
MTILTRSMVSLRQSVVLAGQALRAWRARQILTAIAATIVVGLLMGFATVLIPNPVFAREIPPVPWNYPAWILASVLTGLLFATYVRPNPPASGDDAAPQTDEILLPEPLEAEERRSSRMGIAGGFLAWFAVGCPVCNKLALLALGYTGAITWFAPIQPYLALLAIILSGLALLWRLRGQVACPATKPREAVHV